MANCCTLRNLYIDTGRTKLRNHRLAGFAALPFSLHLWSHPEGLSRRLRKGRSAFPSLPRAVDVWQWFAAPPKTNTYGYQESLLRIAVSQRIHSWDWKLELSQPAELWLPNDAISPISAQGQLGLGGTYYASNGNNSYPAAAFLKQGFLRYRFNGVDRDVRIGRFEFLGGVETQPKNPTILWLQNNRVQQRLVEISDSPTLSAASTGSMAITDQDHGT